MTASSIPASMEPHTARLINVIWQIVAIWVVSDIGYYFLLPALNIRPSYNDASMEIALYYIFWSGMAVITFWPVYRTWSVYGPRKTFESRLYSYAVWCGSFALCLLFVGYVLPQLPAVSWKERWSPPEFIMATPNYWLFAESCG